MILLLSDSEHSLAQAMKVVKRGPRPDQISLTIRREKFSGKKEYPILVRLQLQYDPPGEMIIDLTSNWTEEGLERFLEVTRQENCFVICFGYIGQGKQGRQAYRCRPWVVMGRPEDIQDQEG